jgi:simple sugar transport system substrate-binding protein
LIVRASAAFRPDHKENSTMHRRNRLGAPLLALTLLLGVVAACSDDDSSSDSGSDDTGSDSGSDDGGDLTIGFITKFPVDFYDTMVEAAEAWGEDHPDVELQFAQGESGTDDEGQIAAIESMITQEVDAIAVTPTSPNVESALQEAVDAGIPVVLMDNDIPGWDGKTSLVATDNLAGGVLAGEFAAENLEDGDTVAVLEGVAGAPSLDDRVTGFLDGLGEDFEVVSSLTTDCDQTKGLDAATDILTANPDVTLIYGACGPPILGAIEAASAEGSDVQLIGFDAGPDEVAAIIAGDELASVAQFPAVMGELGVETAWQAANGETVEDLIDTGTEMVTADNASDFE